MIEPLTEDELGFYLEYSGSGFKYELTHNPRYTNPWSKEEAEKVKQQILQAIRLINDLKRDLADMERTGLEYPDLSKKTIKGLLENSK